MPLEENSVSVTNKVMAIEFIDVGQYKELQHVTCDRTLVGALLSPSVTSTCLNQAFSGSRLLFRWLCVQSFDSAVLAHTASKFVSLSLLESWNYC